MRQRELPAVAPRAAAEAGQHRAAPPVEDVDPHAVLVEDEQQALLRVGRERQRHRGAAGAGAGGVARGHGVERHVDVADERAHPVEDLDAVRLPVADVDQAVAGHAQAVRQRRDVPFRRGPVERPLAEELPVAVEHRDPVVAGRGLAVGHVDVAGRLVDVEARRQEELRAAGVERPPGARAVRRVVAARLADLLQQLAAVAGVPPHHPGPGRDDPQAAVGVDVAVVQPVADPRRIAPAPDHAAPGVELDDRRRRAGAVEIRGDDVPAVEDEDPIPAADAHPAETAGEPPVAERQLRPEGIELVAGRLLLRGGRLRAEDADGGRQRDAGAGGRPRGGVPEARGGVPEPGRCAAAGRRAGGAGDRRRDGVPGRRRGAARRSARFRAGGRSYGGVPKSHGHLTAPGRAVARRTAWKRSTAGRRRSRCRITGTRSWPAGRGAGRLSSRRPGTRSR